MPDAGPHPIFGKNQHPMLYKFLALEALLICGMLYLRFEPKVTFGGADNEVTTLRTEPVADTGKDVAPPSVTAAPSSRPVKKITPPVIASVDAGLVFPVADHGPEHVISVFGDKRGKSRLHQGIDIKAPRGTDVVATIDGFVERIKNGGSGGKCVYLRGRTGRLFYYAHLDDIDVEEYTAVRAGEVLGQVGDTGNAKGTTPHLHFEVMVGKGKEAVDPLGYWVGV